MGPPDQPVNTSIINTKLVPPAYRRPLVSRDRILEKLRGGRYRTLTLIKGPAGFGKTTLLAQWRKELVADGAAVAWLSLDENDNEITQFLSYLVASLRHAGIQVGEGALAVYKPSSPDAAGAFMAALVNELHGFQQPVYLLVDDYHHIVDGNIHSAMYQLLYYAPEDFHLVVASRTEPLFSLAQFRVHDQLTELDPTDLRFDFEESSRYLSDRLTGKLDPAQLRQLYEITEGWVAGLQLASISLRDHPHTQEYIQAFAEQSRNIADYLAADVVDHLPTDVAEFLFKTSVLTRLQGDLCEAVTGLPDAAGMLKRLETGNLFVLPMENETQWYRYHPLFANYLRGRLTERKDIDPIELHQRASTWFADHGFAIDAVRHALDAGDVEQALSTVEHCAMPLIKAGHPEMLLSWVKRLPVREVTARLRLRVATVWALALSFQLDEATEILETLEATPSRIDPETAFELELLRCLIAVYRDDSATALQLSTDLVHAVSRVQNPFLLTATNNILTFAYLHAERLQEARDAQIPALRWDTTERSFFGVVYSQCLLGLSYALEGDMAHAEKIYRNTLHDTETRAGRRSAPACLTASLLSEVLYETNRLEELSALLAHRFDVISEVVISDGIIRAYLSQARSHAARGDTDAALGLCQRLQSRGEGSKQHRLIAVGLSERMRLHLRRHELSGAQSLWKRLDELAQRYAGASFSTHGEIHLTARLARIRLLIAEAAHAEAQQSLEALLHEHQTSQRAYLKVQLHLLMAINLWTWNRHQEADPSFKRALALGYRLGLVRIFADEGMVCRELIERQQARSRVAEPCVPETYLKTLLSAFQTEVRLLDAQASKARPAATDTSPEPLTNREREVLELLARGLPNKHIAKALHISVNSVKWHLKNLYAKLDVSSRTQAVSRARDLGVV